MCEHVDHCGDCCSCICVVSGSIWSLFSNAQQFAYVWLCIVPGLGDALAHHVFIAHMCVRVHLSHVRMCILNLINKVAYIPAFGSCSLLVCVCCI